MSNEIKRVYHRRDPGESDGVDAHDYGQSAGAAGPVLIAGGCARKFVQPIIGVVPVPTGP